MKDAFLDCLQNICFNKKILILGFGLEGRSTANLLTEAGILQEGNNRKRPEEACNQKGN